jgi:superfamily II DNA or RNA helicase
VDLFRLSALNKFAEFESQVAALPSERDRGNAFEVFAEAWLATQRIPQAREVWPGNTPPLSLQESLRLPLNDMGVDGVFESASDDPTCYQVKFRTGRPRLSWSDLSTFFGLADAPCGRLVFTNCDEIARIAEARRDVVFVRGSDLDRLTKDDLAEMDAWLAGSITVRKTKSPRPHQEAAIVDILASFEHHSRATALMACATGKTLISLWVAERLEAKTVLVLLPSLALVRQTLHEWLHETNWLEPQYRCVCSDPTVLPDEDALVVRQTDLDFKVTTESSAVRRFLTQPANGVRIVFSTYQSSEVVASAMVGLPPFDLAIFDEAHKTAGLEGLRSAVALKDDRLPILRRLFLTATPRHYSVTTREKSGGAKIVFSMDVPEVYGVVAHSLPFSAAAKAGIITNYKVVISIVTSEEVTTEAIRRGVVLVKGDKVKARQVAHQIALQAAISRYGVRKIFTFHGRVAAAASFVSSGPEGIATHLPDFHCDHISGAMPTGQRERRMREFESKPRAVMSNARCLTEGVDVPAVDMVAFLSPRRSLVDIVQATGRAMRHAEGKTFGYVFVPLYVEQSRGETTLEAVKRSNYDEIWNVLNRLQEHDDLLAQIIDDLRTQRGETGGFDDTRFRERVEVLGSSMSLEDLRRSITAACIDAIGDPWMERYGQLTAYYKQQGNCDIPVRFAANRPLATWVVAQRYERRLGKLSQERIQLLDRLAFTWEPYNAEWRGNYLALRAFKERYGHCRVPTNSKEYKGLRAWVRSQRRKRTALDEERTRLLEKLGFEWQSALATWDERFEELRLFKEKFGHVRVPVTWKENKTLAGWVVRQRVWKRAGKISIDHQQRLEAVGFEWDLIADPDEQWGINIKKLREFSAANGHTLVSASRGDDPVLSRWLANVRRLLRRGKLSADQIDILDQLGVTDNASTELRARHWDTKFRQLETLLQTTGSCDPSRGARDPEMKLLCSWTNDQRMLNRRGLLDATRVARLESLGFRWEPNGDSGGDGTSRAHLLQTHTKTWE